MKKDDGTFSTVSYNSTVSAFTGVRTEDIGKLDWSKGYCTDIIEEDVPKMKAALDRLCKIGDTSGIDYKIHKNGSWMARLEELLSQLSFRDSLTGLFNRNKFNHMLSTQHAKGRPLGIACLDINGLKAANDQFGHSYGDRLIKKTADIIRKYFKDEAYRIGGDEFVIIDSRLDERKFTERVAQLYRMMEENGIPVAAGLSWRCGKECSCKEQFEEADRLMYQDKEAFYDGRKRTDVKNRASDNPA